MDRKEQINQLRAKQTRKERDEALSLLAVAAITLATTSVTLIKARRAAKRGDWNEAIFYAILWVGYSNNGNLSFIHRSINKKGITR